MLAFMTTRRHPPSAQSKAGGTLSAADLVCGEENKERAMHGDQGVLEYLNKALRHELTAVNQYWLHYRILDNWGFKALAKTWRKESIEEMEHADLLIARILFLEGHPNMQPSDGLRIGQDIKSVLECDLAAEVDARALYLEAARHCETANDRVSKNVFEKLTADEEHHIDFLETQIELIRQIGVELYAQKHMGGLEE
jgi:bacterioferritin